MKAVMEIVLRYGISDEEKEKILEVLRDEEKFSWRKMMYHEYKFNVQKHEYWEKRNNEIKECIKMIGGRW